ncbi:MAG: hypothetical protein ACK5LJ_07370 [Paracoccus sp. (in: a-proteobacteria)]
MQRAANLIMCILCLIFVISSLRFSLSDRPETLIPAPIFALSQQLDPDGLAEIFLRPEHPAMWLLLVALWTGLTIFGLSHLLPRRSAPDYNLTGAPLLGSAFASGAIWPWIAVWAQLTGFLLCVSMLLALIAAGSSTLSDPRLARHPMIGMLTGWATIVTFAAFASFLSMVTPLPDEIMALAAALLSCGATIAIQLRMPKNPTYTGTVMFALLATAATMIESNPMIAVIAVLTISALTFLLVRVTT